MNDFERQEPAPTDIYEYEKSAKGGSRFQASLVATAGFIIFGGLVGGGAFAMTGGLTNILPANPNTANVNPAATDPAAIDPLATPTDTLLDPSATPTDTTLLDPSATPTDTPLDPSATPTPGTQIVVPPVFGGGDDGEGEHQGNTSGEHHKGDGKKHHRPNPTASIDPTAPPVFGGDDDNEGDDGN